MATRGLTRLLIPDINCPRCLQPFSFAEDGSNYRWDRTAKDVIGFTCLFCKRESFYCNLCVKRWKDVRNNTRHIKSDCHQQVLAKNNNAQHQLLLHTNQQQTASGANDDEDWPPSNGSNCDDLFLSSLCATAERHANQNNHATDDWLTSIPQQLGRPAHTLEAILQGGSFPSDSCAPAFYYFESKHPGHGAKYLAAKPFGVPPSEVSDEEAEFHLRMTRFLNRLTKKDQAEFAYYLLNVFNARDKSRTIFKSTRPPLSTEDFQDFYLGGRSSITKHLPTPVVVKTTDNTHSYVTLTDVIQNMLAASTSVDHFQFETDLVPKGLQSEFFDNEQTATISNTRAAYTLFLDLQEIGTGFVLYLWIKRWCDDFDPNNTKTSRNQVWLMTNTVCPPPGESKGRNTFFMAIGQKGDDHQEIDKIFEEELSVLSSTGRDFYHGGRKEIIRVKAGTVCVCVDRPERASLYQIGDHTGTFSTLWGHAISVDGKCNDNCLPSCPFCRRQRYNRLLNNTNLGEIPPDLECPNDEGEGRCVSWNVMNSDFTCASPTDYPTICDMRAGAPPPPLGREVSATGSQRLPCIYLTIEWLTVAVIFAHHQLKTNPPDSHPNKRFWTKAHATAFLRTCGIGTQLIEVIYESAKNKDERPPLPYSWVPRNALQNTHYAAMHMLFLGHAKSNYNMVNKFHAYYKLSSTVGRQANKYLRDIQSLRCNRFFDAQPLSTSTWGTGVWVSENYLFWVRAINFFCTLPAILHCKQAQKESFKKDSRMMMRFCSSSLAAISCIMSPEKAVGDMDEKVKLYLDTMVEMDRWIKGTGLDIESTEGSVDDILTSSTAAHSSTDDDVTLANTTADHISADGGGASASTTAARSSTVDAGVTENTSAARSETNNARPSRKRKNKCKETYNFCKSNSLGILSVAAAHRHHGPAVLHWEGGWAGERKIQPAKALLGIKRSTSDWQKIVLQNLWRDNKLTELLEPITPTEQRRDIEGLIRIYSSLATLKDNVTNCKPLSGMLTKDGSVMVAYRPTTEEYRNDTSRKCLENWSRSALQLLTVKFDDAKGHQESHLCWFSPISLSTTPTLTLGSAHELKNHADQYVLLLPQINDDEQYQNLFYTIGSLWTERVCGGSFQRPRIAPELFEDDWHAAVHYTAE